MLALEGYNVSGKLGDGGMATVFQGVQESLKRPVAIKVLKQNLVNHNEVRKRFDRESLIIAKLHHPNIVHVIDQGITSKGLPYFIMPYVQSLNLTEVMNTGATTPEQAVDFFKQIAGALAYAHKNGVIHCDIKPDNILVDFEGHVQILDFGIAKIFDETKKDKQDKEYVMGSFSYMAPEQRESSENASEKSDMFSLGVVMYQFFTGQIPRGTAVRPSKINPSLDFQLDKIIMECLALDASKRPSAEKLKHQLIVLLQGKHLDKAQRERAVEDVKKNFRLLDAIKEDEYGAVYLFREDASNTFLLIKKKNLPNAGYGVSSSLSELHHENIANIYGTSKNSRCFILVSEYCHGGSLNERLLRPFDSIEFAPIAVGIARGLLAAHKANIIHGNLRPSNVLFDENNTVKLTDFGLEEHYSHSEKDNWFCIDADPSTKKADVFSVGMMYYFMLCGEKAELRHDRYQMHPLFKAQDILLQRLIESMIQIDTEKRLGDFHKVVNTLLHMKNSQETIVRPRSPKTPAPQKPTPEPQRTSSTVAVKKKPKGRLVFLLTLMLMVAFIVGLEIYLLSTGKIDIKSLPSIELDFLP